MEVTTGAGRRSRGPPAGSHRRSRRSVRPVLRGGGPQRRVLEVIARLLDAARAAGRPVIYTRVAWSPDYSDLDANSPLLQIAQQAGALTEGDPKTEIVAGVAPRTQRPSPHPQADRWVQRQPRPAAAGREIETVLSAGSRQTRRSRERPVASATPGTGCHGRGRLLRRDPEAHQASIASMGLIESCRLGDRGRTSRRAVDKRSAHDPSGGPRSGGRAALDQVDDSEDVAFDRHRRAPRSPRSIASRSRHARHYVFRARAPSCSTDSSRDRKSLRSQSRRLVATMNGDWAIAWIRPWNSRN